MQFMQAKRDGAGTVLTFSGRLDTVASAELKQPIRTEIDHQPTNLNCDFQNVTYIGSAVLRLIFEAARELQRRHGTFRITNCSSDLRRVFALTGMDHLIEGGPGPQFTHEIVNRTLRIFMNGRMDAAHVSGIRLPIRQLITTHSGPVRFEISAVPYAASAFVHLCIDASKLAKASGHDFGVERVIPDVAHIFRLAGLQTLLLSSV